MIERICPKCRVPMNGEKCIKPNCGCKTEMSSTIYWCEECKEYTIKDEENVYTIF